MLKKKQKKPTLHTRWHCWLTAEAYPVSLNICWSGISTAAGEAGVGAVIWLEDADQGKTGSFCIYSIALLEGQQVVIFKAVVKNVLLWMGSFAEDVLRVCTFKSAEDKIKALRMPHHTYKEKCETEDITN